MVDSFITCYCYNYTLTDLRNVTLKLGMINAVTGACDAQYIQSLLCTLANNDAVTASIMISQQQGVR